MHMWADVTDNGTAAQQKQDAAGDSEKDLEEDLDEQQQQQQEKQPEKEEEQQQEQQEQPEEPPKQEEPPKEAKEEEPPKEVEPPKEEAPKQDEPPKEEAPKEEEPPKEEDKPKQEDRPKEEDKPKEDKPKAAAAEGDVFAGPTLDLSGLPTIFSMMIDDKVGRRASVVLNAHVISLVLCGGLVRPRGWVLGWLASQLCAPPLPLCVGSRGCVHVELPRLLRLLLAGSASDLLPSPSPSPRSTTAGRPRRPSSDGAALDARRRRMAAALGPAAPCTAGGSALHVGTTGPCHAPLL